jgi:hypothetical protein
MRVRPKTGSYSGHLLKPSLGISDKGKYEGTNESVVDGGTRGDCHIRGTPCTIRTVPPCVLTFGRASTNRCLSN